MCNMLTETYHLKVWRSIIFSIVFIATKESEGAFETLQDFKLALFCQLFGDVFQRYPQHKVLITQNSLSNLV